MDDYDRLYSGGSRWPFSLRFRKHKFAVYPGTRIYYTHESRRGWFTMGRQIADRLYRMETLRRRRRSLRTNKCEIRCIHNAKGWFARNGHPRHGRGAAPSPPPPGSRAGNQLDTERKRCVCSRERDERRKIATENQRSNCFMKNYTIRVIHVSTNLN